MSSATATAPFNDDGRKKLTNREKRLISLSSLAGIGVAIGTIAITTYDTWSGYRYQDQIWDKARKEIIVSSDGQYKSMENESITTLLQTMDSEHTTENFSRFGNYENLIIVDQVLTGPFGAPSGDRSKYVKVVMELKGKDLRLMYYDLNGLEYARAPVDQNDKRTVYLTYAQADTLNFFTLLRSTGTRENSFKYSLKIFNSKDSLLAKFPMKEEYKEDKLFGIKKYPIADVLYINPQAILAKNK